MYFKIVTISSYSNFVSESPREVRLVFIYF